MNRRNTFGEIDDRALIGSFRAGPTGPRRCHAWLAVTPASVVDGSVAGLRDGRSTGSVRTSALALDGDLPRHRPPGVGVSSTVAATALVAAAWTDHRVALLDAAAQGTRPASTLLGALPGPSGAALAGLPQDRPASRRRIRSLASPGGAVPSFTTLHAHASWTVPVALGLLRHRADLVLVDVPWGHLERTRETW